MSIVRIVAITAWSIAVPIGIMMAIHYRDWGMGVIPVVAAGMVAYNWRVAWAGRSARKVEERELTAS